MKGFKKLVFTAVLSLSIAGGVWANGLSLNSVGAKALGMGGAYVGLANDLTAIYWNPAGLAGQNTEIMIFGTDVIPMATYKYDPAMVDATTETNHYFSPNIFFNYAMGDWSFGFGAYVPAGLGAEWNGEDLKNMTGGMAFNWMSKIGVFDFSPTVAYKFNDKFSIGVALNIYYAMFDMDNPGSAGQYTESSTGTGFGAAVGLKYNVNEKFSLGLSYRTPVNVTMDGTAKDGAMDMDMSRDVEWPTWIAGGLAFHVNEKWVITADLQYSNWAAFKDLQTDYTVSGNVISDTVLMDWEDAIQYRIGTAYQFNESFTGRLGYYYDPAPAPDETLNILFPSSTNNVITAGASYMANKFYVDFGLEYLIGAEREAAPSPHNMPGTHQMDVFAFSIGFGYVFK